MPTLSRVHASLSTHSNDTHFTRFVMSAIAFSASTARAAFASKGYVRSRERRHESSRIVTNRRACRSPIGRPDISRILTTPHPPPSLSVPSNRSLSSRLRVRAKLAAPVGNEPRARRAVTVYAGRTSSGPDDDDDESATSAKSAPMLEKYKELSEEFGRAEALVTLIDMDLPGGAGDESDELEASVTKLTALINELGEFVQDHDANGGYQEGLVDLSREKVSEIVDWMEDLSSRME